MLEKSKIDSLKDYIKNLGNVVVAYSGGVDSNLLLKVAKDTLGDNVIAVTVHAPVHSDREIKEAIEYTKKYGVKHIVLKIDDLELEELVENGSQRCYYCKKYIFTQIKQIARENNIENVVDGTNLDDLGDYRPGLKALEELSIISPLKECGFSKSEIRDFSYDLKLETYNKPAFACLASRVPYGTKITVEKLRAIEESENYLIELGFKQFRVRMHDEIARVEVDKKEIEKFFVGNTMEKVDNRLKELGFNYVTLDMSGYKMGSMNVNVE